MVLALNLFTTVLFWLFVLLTPVFGQPLKIGVSSMITPMDTVLYYQEIIDYIGQKINRPVEMVHRRTYNEMDIMLKKEEVQVAFICSAPYVKNKRDFDVQLLVAPSVNGRSVYHAYIIVHKDSGINIFPEFKGKTFVFADPHSNTGRLYPLYLIKTMGQNTKAFFKKTTYSHSHNKSVELVAKKIVDGASVDSLIYDYMVKMDSPYAKQTKVIKRSPPFGIPPVVVTKGVDPSLKRALKQAFLDMHKDDIGKRILQKMNIDSFVEVSDSAYDSIRKMENSLSKRLN